ncbi:MAG: M24 family metallopeptidase [Flexilinea sp.]
MNKQRLFQKMEVEHLDYMLLCSQENVAYTTGLGIPIPYGAIFAYGGGYPLGYSLISLKDQTIKLIISDFFMEVSAVSFADEKLHFSHYDHFIAVDGTKELLNCFSSALPVDGDGMTIGIEENACPVVLYKLLKKLGFTIGDAYPTVNYMRIIKTESEIEKIRGSVYIEDCGQNTLLNYARNFNGESDFEMWSGVTESMNKAAGKVVRIVGELAVGANVENTSGLGGPTGLLCHSGDMGRMDISIRHNGYWCDCTNTVVFGKKPNAKQLEYFKMVLDAYEAAKEKLVPGNRLSDVCKAEAEAYARYGRKPVVYTGHQIGCGVNEPARIVCYEDEILKPSMVVCIEPQQYGEKGSCIGVRLEKVIVIREDGPEELNSFVWGMDI